MLSHLAVINGKYCTGVEGDTCDWRYPVTHPRNTGGVLASAEVQELLPALHREYPFEAYALAYVLHDQGIPLVRQPRVNKGGIEYVRSQGFTLGCYNLIADVDNPGTDGGKTRTTQEHLDRYAPLLEQIPCIGWYETPNGIRVVQQLVQPVEPEAWEECVETLCNSLADVGIEPDWGCRDWTRHFAMPNVRRKVQGKMTDFRPRAFDMRRMEPITPNPTKFMRRGSNVVTFADRNPSLATRVPTTLPVISLRGYVGERHAIMLAVAGTLLAEHVKAEVVPDMVYAISLAAGAPPDHAEDDRRGARNTVNRWLAQLPVSGYRALNEHAPDIAAVLNKFFAASALQRAHELNNLPEPKRDKPAVAYKRVVTNIRKAPPYLTVIQAMTGIGKSRATRDVAAERARKQPKPRRYGSLSTRAAVQSKTGISVPTHALAAEYIDALAVDGVPAMLLFGILSKLDADGKPVCKFPDAAHELALGRLSAPRLLCEGNGKAKCEHAATCPAYGGREGPDDARIAVAPHQLISRLDGFAGTTGLIVIDEPPDLLDAECFTADDFAQALVNLGYFSQVYGAAIAPALWCIGRWMADVSLPAKAEMNFKSALALAAPADLLARALEAVGTDDPRVAARAAFPPDHDPRLGKAPPVEQSHLIPLRASKGIARKIGQAARVLGMVWRACQADERVSTRVELRGPKEAPYRVLIVTAARPELSAAILNADRPCVIIDANADLHLPVLRRLHHAHFNGSVPDWVDDVPANDAPPPHAHPAPFPVVSIFAVEAPTARKLCFTTGASRKRVLPANDTGPLLTYVKQAVACALDGDVTRALFVSFLPVVLMLRAAAETPAASAERWHHLGLDQSDLTRLALAYRPIVEPLIGRLALAHFGAVRGLDGLKDCNVSVTICDPILNLGEVQHEVAFVDLPGGWEGRAEARARAELEQAHGRLRTIHRTTPCRQYHIGKVLPGGWFGAEIATKATVLAKVDGGALGGQHGIKGGRPANDAAMTAAEAQVLVTAAGGRKAAIEATGIASATLSRYLAGKRDIPSDAAVLLRGLASAAHPEVA